MVNNILFPVFGTNEKPFILDKEGRIRDHIAYMATRLATMFDWRGLPDTIPQRVLEYLLQFNGNACVFEYDGGIYATFGGLGGEPDYNYEPTLYVISNPALNYSAELKIGSECVRLRGDSYGYGLAHLHERYASQLEETDISLRTMMINYRMGRGIVADNDRAYESAKEFLRDFEDGRLAAISSDEFFEGVHALEQSASGQNIKDLIEVEQYLKASWYNEVGLNSNYNMKRERIMASESQMVDDALLPLVDDMLESRRRGCKEVNEMFGTEWSVNLAGAWLKEHLKQSVQGADFDSDGDENIDEESVEEVDSNVADDSGDDIGSNSIDMDDMDIVQDDTRDNDGNGLEKKSEDETTEEVMESSDNIEVNVTVDIDENVSRETLEDNSEESEEEEDNSEESEEEEEGEEEEDNSEESEEEEEGEEDAGEETD